MKKTLLLASVCLCASLTNAQQWQAQAEGFLPVGYEILSISAVDENVVWVTASDINNFDPGAGVPASHVIRVLVTIDGGITWTTHKVEEATGKISWDIQGIDENVAWISTYDYNSGAGKGIMKTEDGGKTWMPLLDYSCPVYYLRVFDELHAYCQSSRYRAWTEDGGNSWVKDTVEEFGADEFVSLWTGCTNTAVIVGDTFWIGTSKNRIFRTTNYGQEYELISTGLPFDGITTIAFKDHLNGLLASLSGKVARTTDGGNTWTALSQQPPDNGIYMLKHVPSTPGTFMLISFSGKVFWTTDFGETWITGEEIGTYISAIDFTSPTNGWASPYSIAGVTSPAMFKWIGEDLVGSRDIMTLLPGFTVSPNPASDLLRFDYTGFTGETVAATLTDALGRVVLYEKINDGQLDVSRLPDGVYYLKIQANGMVGVARVVKM